MDDQTSINSPLIQEVKLKHSLGRGVEEDHEQKHKGGIVLDQGHPGNKYHTVRSAGVSTLRGGTGSLGKQDSCGVNVKATLALSAVVSLNLLGRKMFLAWSWVKSQSGP